MKISGRARLVPLAPGATTAAPPPPVLISTSTTLLFQTAANDASNGTSAWSNTANALDSDADEAVAGAAVGQGALTTQYLKLTNLAGASAIPIDATIAGLELKVTAREVAAGDGVPVGVITRASLVKADGTFSATDVISVNIDLTITATVYTLGSSTELWGETPTPTDLRDSDFGVILQGTIQTGGGSVGGSNLAVRYVEMVVYYSYFG